MIWSFFVFVDTTSFVKVLNFDKAPRSQQLEFGFLIFGI